VVADIGLRLQEGIQDLKLEQQLAPAREAVARTLTVGSTNFFKAVEGVRERWAQRTTSNTTVPTTSSSATSVNEDLSKSSRASTPPVEVSKSDYEDIPQTAKPADYGNANGSRNLRPFSLTSTNSLPSDSPSTSPTAGIASPLKPLSAWGAGLGSFLSAKTSRFSMALKTPTGARPEDAQQPTPAFPPTPLAAHEHFGEPEGSPLFNGMSPGVSPTAATTQAQTVSAPSIASVLSQPRSSMSSESGMGSSKIVYVEPEVVKPSRVEPSADDSGFRVL